MAIGGLFSGVGGIELGFSRAGYDIAWANEMDPLAARTYESIHGHPLTYNYPLEQLIERLDSGEVELEPVEVLVGGFPCQAFSVAGYRRGFEDERGNVFFRIIDILQHFQNMEGEQMPRALLLENVKNFRTHDDCRTYNTCVQVLNEMGYSVFTRIMNTCEYSDVPQNRERTFMCCFLGESAWNDETLTNEERATQCPITQAFSNNFPQIVDYTRTIQELLLDIESNEFYYGRDKAMYDMLVRDITRVDTIYQYRRVYVRENQSNQCPTLTANMGTGGHNVPLIRIPKDNPDRMFRKLTPKECFLFQGYPDDIQLPDIANCHLYKQAGNSVSVPVIEALARSIRIALDHEIIDQADIQQIA